MTRLRRHVFIRNQTARRLGAKHQMAVLAQAPAYVLQAEEPAWQFCTGSESITDGNYNYWTAWFDVPGGAGQPAQRYVVCRLIVPIPIAKQINEDARQMWGERTH